MRSANIIPLPVYLMEAAGRFALGPSVRIVVSNGSLKSTAKILADLLGMPMGAAPDIHVTADASADMLTNAIVLTTRGAETSLGNEGYTLSVKPDGVMIRANTPSGLFYGIQSLRQMLPPQVESRARVDGVNWSLPCVEISDAPRCRWRGLMLDCSRHFFGTDELKRLLDLMALYKLNTFHWHLTDNEGWRVEIKKYLKLTEIGAWRDAPGFGLDPDRSKQHIRASDGKYGGFYTQDDVREIVAYAAQRHITIVPEIDMPGHAFAALAVYPELGLSHHPMLVPVEGGIQHIFDPTSKATYAFIDDVLSEIVQLFPGPFIHVGGDEVPKEPWKASQVCQTFIRANELKDENELQSYFMKRVATLMQARGKRMIGWDEILEGGLAPGAAVMSWRSLEGAITAARAGHDVVLTPASHLYLDYGQTKAPDQPKVIGGYLPLSQVYAFDPMPAELTPDQRKHVLGAQGNIWTEYMPNLQQVELMAFPRALAVAELAWTPQAQRNFADFLNRLDHEEERLNALGVGYFRCAGMKE